MYSACSVARNRLCEWKIISPQITQIGGCRPPKEDSVVSEQVNTMNPMVSNVLQRRIGVFVIFIQGVMCFIGCLKNRTESDDSDMPWRRLKSILLRRTISCVAARNPLGYSPLENARAGSRSAPCSSSLLNLLKHWGEIFGLRCRTA